MHSTSAFALVQTSSGRGAIERAPRAPDTFAFAPVLAVATVPLLQVLGDVWVLQRRTELCAD